MRGIGQLIVQQIPPRALRALVGMTIWAGVLVLGSTPARERCCGIETRGRWSILAFPL
jgi:hypothetical protein